MLRKLCLADMNNILIADIQPIHRKAKIWMITTSKPQVSTKPVSCTLGVMSEDQAERVAERRQDRLDARYLRGELTEAEYGRECRAIDAWVSAALRRVGG